MLSRFRSLFRLVARSDRGASAIDYSLIAAIVAVAGISALRASGKGSSVLNAIANTF